MERIMIVDSDLIQIKLLREGLSNDYLTLVSNRGSNAMDLFKVFQPSALVLDPATHDLNGREFIKKVRTLPFRGNIPIFAMTRFTSLKMIVESFDLGADMIISKPCSAERIKESLGHFLSQKSPIRLRETAEV